MRINLASRIQGHSPVYGNFVNYHCGCCPVAREHMIDKQNKIAQIESTEMIEIHELAEVIGTRVVVQHSISTMFPFLWLSFISKF